MTSRDDLPSFPRTRGDGPPGDTLSEFMQSFPPHTRGWTAVAEAISDNAGVSPAHAGMDPPESRLRPRKRSFPRTRGDGPLNLAGGRSQTPFPPHTRGWTVVAKVLGELLVVSPAHAGMDPWPCVRAWKRARFPRTRGDEPRVRVPLFVIPSAAISTIRDRSC